MIRGWGMLGIVAAGYAALVGLAWMFQRRLLRDRYASIERIGDLTCPLLVVAGENDAIVPAEQSGRLYEACSGVEKRLLILPGTDHNDFELLAGERMLSAISDFLEDVLDR